MFGLSPGLVGKRGTWYQGLFYPSDSGMIFDFNKLSSLFQDTSHTVPVTTAGDPISAIQCQITGAYAILNAGSCTLGYDSTLKMFRGEIDGSCNFQAHGTLPSAFGGNALATMISVCEFVTNTKFYPNYIGTAFPTIPGAGECLFVAQDQDPGWVLEMIQVGASRGFQGTQQNGKGTYIGVKTAGTGPNDSSGPYCIYANGSKLSNVTGANSLTGTLGNITDLTFDIGRGNGAGNIYSTGCIARAITATEIARITDRGLKA